jgi:endonuclease/exonuclease/phosphatase family metal-dependent hydrolase
LIGDVASVVAAVGVLLGGGWTLYRYRTARHGAAEVHLELRARSAAEVLGRPTIVVNAAAENRSGVLVPLRVATLSFRSLALPRSPRVFRRLSNPDHPGGHFIRVFRVHTSLEPGERFAEDVLIEIPAQVAVEVVLRMESVRHPHWWQTSMIYLPTVEI